MDNFSPQSISNAGSPRSSKEVPDVVEPEAGPNIKKLRAAVMMIQKTRLTYSILGKNLATMSAANNIFRRKAIANDAGEKNDEFLKKTQRRDPKQIIQDMKAERNRIDRNKKTSFVSKQQVDEEIDLCYDDDRKLVVQILKEKPDVRYDDEILYIQKILENVKFFADVKKEIHPKHFLNIFKQLKIEEFEVGEKVFKEGSLGKKFYVIIEGSAYVLLTKKGIIQDDVQKTAEQQAALKAEKQKSEEAQDGLLTETAQTEKARRRKIEKMNPGCWITKVIEQGQSFGDIALMATGERQRTATIVAKEKLILGVLEFSDYKDILGEYYVKRNNKKLDLLTKMDLFQHWNQSQISSLLHHMEEAHFNRKHVIFHEGDTANNYLYFILSGEVELRKTATTSTNDYFGDSSAVERRRSRLTQAPETVRLALISQGEYFGEGEIITAKPREYTAVVHSFDVQLLTISKEKFTFFVKDTKTLKKISEHTKYKKTLHEGFVSKFLAVNQYFSRQSLDSSQDNINRSFSKVPGSPKDPKTLAVPYPDSSNPLSMTLSLFKKSKEKASLNQSKLNNSSHKILPANISGIQTTHDDDYDRIQPNSPKETKLSTSGSFLGMKHIMSAEKRRERLNVNLNVETSENVKTPLTSEMRISTSASAFSRKHVKSTERLTVNTKIQTPQIRVFADGQDSAFPSPIKSLKPSGSSASLHRKNILSIEKSRFDPAGDKPTIATTIGDEQSTESTPYTSFKMLKNSVSMKNRFIINAHSRSPDVVLTTQEASMYQNTPYMKTGMSDPEEKYSSASLLNRAKTPLIKGYQTSAIQLFGSPRPQLYISSAHKTYSNFKNPFKVDSAAMQVVTKKEALDFFEEGRRSDRASTAIKSRREGSLRKKSLKMNDVRIKRTKKPSIAEMTRGRLSPSRSPESITVSRVEKLERLDVQKVQIRTKAKERRTGH